MGESLNCQFCSKVATVHLTQIVNNEIHKVHLCEDCAQSQGVTDPAGFSLENLFTGSESAASEAESEETPVCEECGHSPKDFRKLGRLGCPACYEHLNSFVAGMLEDMHRGLEHKGKAPAHSLDRVEFKRVVRSREKALAEAVEDERFEDAARLRDELKEIRAAGVVPKEVES